VITCPFCGSPNEAEASFCGNCGKSLAAAAAPAPAQQPTAPPPPPEAPIASPAQAAPVAPVTVTCPNCGSPNHPSRTFCWKCAAPLRELPAPKVARFDLGFWVTFLLSSVVGVAVVVGSAALLHIGKSDISPVAFTRPNGDPIQFAVTPGTPKPLPKLPTNSTIQLASYKQAATATLGPDANGHAPWWNDSVPRIPAVSQFDGGPQAKINCVMASGAMLARLGFGIVTSGSQLRALQDSQGGPTNYADLSTAVSRGWGVTFLKGDLSALELRALLWAGAGAVIGVVYGEVPVNVRLQESFTGNHSIYIDAFRPAGPDGPAAYYVMDPIGHTWAGYKGGWWPADAVEKAAYAHSGGKISATWAFAGGVVPKNHPILPRDAYPTEPTAAPSLEPTSQPSAGTGDPMPTGNTTLSADPGIGDPPPDVPQWIPADFVTNLYIVDPSISLPTCATTPTPPGCPVGVIGIADFSGPLIPVATPPPSPITLLYANPIAVGTYQIIFSAPADTQQSLWLWNSNGGGALVQQPVEQGLIGGNPVSFSTITVDPAGSFSFLATATGAGTSASSTIGSLVIR
jgi:hypothetical protein